MVQTVQDPEAKKALETKMTQLEESRKKAVEQVSACAGRVHRLYWEVCSGCTVAGCVRRCVQRVDWEVCSECTEVCAAGVQRVCTEACTLGATSSGSTSTSSRTRIRKSRPSTRFAPRVTFAHVTFDLILTT